MHVLEKHKMDVSAALKDPEGLMVIGVFFDIKDKRTQTVYLIHLPVNPSTIF